jgi:uncharacterized iron-regulated protein
MSPLRALAALFVIAGCGGKYAGGPTAKAPGLSKGGLDGAALPYQVLDARTGHQVDEAALWPRLVQARAVCVGEEHPNPHHHWVQLHVVRELGKRLPKTDKLALGLEMVQRPFQGPLDDYASKRIDAAALRSRVGWEERWGYDWSFYAPTFDAAISFGGKLLALNAPKELTKKVVRQGLDALTADEKAQVPELKLDDAAHRAWFDNLMESMGGASVHTTKSKDGDDDATKDKEAPAPSPPAPNPHGQGDAPAMPSAERIYTVQVIWDETMADGAAKWLAANPNGHLIILAGNGHCHDSAIVGRLKRRGIADVLSVRAVIDDSEGGVAEVLAKPMNDYVFVLQLPQPETKLN